MPTDAPSYFDRSAAQWDQEPRRLALVKAVGGAILRDTRPTREMDVLDYGCGTGLLGLFLLPHVRSVTVRGQFTGMLDVLRSKIREGGLTAMKVMQLDLEKQPVSDARFHMVVSSMVMHHVADVAGVLRAFHEMLLPSGVVCLADLDTEPALFHTAEAAGSVHHHGFDRSEFKARLETAGFRNIKVTSAHVVQKPVDGGELHDFPVFLMVGWR